MRPEIFFNSPGLLSLTSDASVDFTPSDFDGPLSDGQRVYLRNICGMDIPRVFWRKQIHGDDILIVKGGAEASEGCPDADAFITNEKKLPIAIRTADCVPVLIFDPDGPAIGVAHAGWKGTYKTIAAKTVQKMSEAYGSRPGNLKIFLGPSIRCCCYQVGGEFRGFFPSHVVEQGGHLYADMPGANRDQLLQEGVRPENIFESGICTCCDKKYFSFRRDGDNAGRMITLMMLV